MYCVLHTSETVALSLSTPHSVCWLVGRCVVSQMIVWLDVIICIWEKTMYLMLLVKTHARTFDAILPKTVPNTTYYNRLNLKFVCCKYLSIETVNPCQPIYIQCFFVCSFFLLWAKACGWFLDPPHLTQQLTISSVSFWQFIHSQNHSVRLYAYRFLIRKLYKLFDSIHLLFNFCAHVHLLYHTCTSK